MVVTVGDVGYGSYEAAFKTDFNGNTRVFVRGREVSIEPILDPVRPEWPPQEPVKPEPLGFTFMHYAHMAGTIRELRNAVVQHKVSGKPLMLESRKKKKES